jgi:hypothetical protein
MQMPTSHGAQICPRCRTRVDARRGPSAICLSCGAPLPNFSGGSGGGSSVLWWALGCGGLFVVVMMAAGAAAFLLRASDDKSSGPTSSVAIESTATAEASASASSSAKVASAPLTDEEKDQLEGNYTCAMDDTPNFPCRVSGGTLEKLAGSQRFRGPISKQSNGNLSFSGTFFCPFGDCTHPVACTFVRQSAGKYVGKFGPNSVPGGGPGGERVVLNKVR